MVKQSIISCITGYRNNTNIIRDIWFNSLEFCNNYFTKETMDENHVVDQFIELKDTLSNYYLPCKSKVYLNEITNKKCITIFRQFIKVHGYTLISKERYINRKKNMCIV